MQWQYCPISIRLINDQESYATSGVSIILSDGDVIRKEYNLSINIIPAKTLTTLNIYVSNEQLINHSTQEIDWLQCDIDFNIPINMHDLTYFKTSGFSVLPQDHVTSSLLTSLVNYDVKLSDKLSYKPLEFITTNQHLPIDIISYPFNFTTPILFSNFKSSGYINYFLPNGYLTDIKYLENCLGSLVNVTNTNGKSIGLVLGNLKKFNGDGDLIIIISWSDIWEIINNQFPQRHVIPDITVNELSGLSAIQQSTDPKNSVLPIVISNHTTTWGSCIIFNHQYLITNNHVIAPFLKLGGTATVYLTNYTINISTTDIITPFSGLDISFIKLSLTNQSKIIKSKNSAVTYSLDYKEDDNVRSIGYGLFFNDKSLYPIISYGNINKIVKSPVPELTNSLIITSSSCWNGSSGGGVFKDNKLIGIICSNAQVKYLNLISNIEQSEKLNKLSFILPIDVVLKLFHEKFNISKDFENLWKLTSVHKDILKSKL